MLEAGFASYFSFGGSNFLYSPLNTAGPAGRLPPVASSCIRPLAVAGIHRPADAGILRMLPGFLSL